MFTYSHVCSSCAREFEQTRRKAYKRYPAYKLCPDCKAGNKYFEQALELGGWGCERRCETCVHFGVPTDRPTNQYWQACGEGKHSKDGLGFLVYFEDVCEEYEPHEAD